MPSWRAWILLWSAAAALLLCGELAGTRWATMLLGVLMLVLTSGPGPGRARDRTLCDAAFAAWTVAADPVRLEREREVMRARLQPGPPGAGVARAPGEALRAPLP